MTNENKISFIAWRFYMVLFFIVCLVICLIIRSINLSVYRHAFLQHEGDARSLRVIDLPAFRGMITDREGAPLAISTAVYSIWMNPKEFDHLSKNVDLLAELLNLKKENILSTYKKNKDKNREFLYLKREVSPEIAAKIKMAQIPGIHQQQEYRRFYPEGEVSAHLVGFTNIDDQGQEGLELAYNSWLSGEKGKKLVLKDRLGRIISEVKELQTQRPGNNLTLSMNQRLQYVAYRELVAAVKKHQANSGSIVVLDTETGEILAMVNYPSFNPNKRSSGQQERLRNRAITDVFEPGSTIKAFSVASALDSGLYQPNSIIDTYPGWLRVGHNLVKDEHSKGPMTVTQILQISSNVGVTKMVLSLPPNQLWGLLHRVGFGEETGIHFPGERSGILIKRDKWSPFALATLAFGYGLSVTPLQLAQAYSVIANEGIKIPLSLLKVTHLPQGKRVMNQHVSKQMLKLLESVVAKGGTGEAASISGYRVAGKTGTAIMIGATGYQKHHYTSSFVGIAPASNPRLVVAVIIHDPKGKEYYGGLVSGPVFKNVMEEALRVLNVPPDQQVG